MKEGISKESNLIIIILSSLGLLFNITEQALRILSKVSVLPNFFVEIVGYDISRLAALVALIISTAAITVAGAAQKPIDGRGWVLKRKRFVDDKVLSHTKFFVLLSILLLFLLNLYISVGLGSLSEKPIFQRAIIQLSAYALFWGLLSYVLVVYLREYQDIRSYQERRLHYPLILQDTVEKHNLIISDKRLKIHTIYQWYGYNLSIVSSGEDYYLIVTSYDGVELRYSKKIKQDACEKFRKSLETELRINQFLESEGNSPNGFASIERPTVGEAS